MIYHNHGVLIPGTLVPTGGDVVNHSGHKQATCPRCGVRRQVRNGTPRDTLCGDCKWVDPHYFDRSSGHV